MSSATPGTQPLSWNPDSEDGDVMFRKIRNTRGYTLIELIIALFLTGVVAAAGFSFYVTMHNQALTQEDISNMQHTNRTTLQEMAKTLRMAGYKLSGHIPYRIAGDSLYVFFSETQPVDTVLYFLQRDPSGSIDDPWTPFRMMRQVNGGTAAIFSDAIHSVNYQVIDSATVVIEVETQTESSDESWVQDDGYRTITLTERVTIRNLQI
jgi:prepilin-type N-terminal cleavage/methylation domain-containing protein